MGFGAVLDDAPTRALVLEVLAPCRGPGDGRGLRGPRLGEGAPAGDGAGWPGQPVEGPVGPDAPGGGAQVVVPRSAGPADAPGTGAPATPGAAPVLIGPVELGVGIA